jgi:hypothetical protein
MPARSLPSYTAGTIAVANGSRTVTGVGTLWLAGDESPVAANDFLIVGAGIAVMIDSIDSANQLTLVWPWPNATAAAGTAYRISRYVPSLTGTMLAAIQAVEARGSDTSAVPSWTVDGGSIRWKWRQSAGGLAALATGATNAPDGALTDRLLVDIAGNVGIGAAPSAKLTIEIDNTANGLRVIGNGAGSAAIPVLEGIGYRADGNGSFGARLAASYRRSDGVAIPPSARVGSVLFGGQHGTDTIFQGSKLRYAASIHGVAEGAYTSASAMPTGLAFHTGAVGEDAYSPNTTYGVERMRIDQFGRVGIGGIPNNRLEVYTAARGTDGLLVQRNGAGSLAIRPDSSAGANNGIAQAGDVALIYTGGTSDTGAIVIAPWATGFSGLRMDNAGIASFSSIVRPGADNAFLLGTAAARWSAIWSATGTIQTSDARAKTDVTDTNLGLAFIDALRPVSYRWIGGGTTIVPGPNQTVEVQATEDVTVETVEIVVENGQAVRRTVTRTETRPLFDELLVVDETGAPVMVEVAPPQPAVVNPETGAMIAPAIPAVMRQATHQVPRMVTVARPTFVEQAIPGARRHYGLIAQEVRAALDAAGVTDFGGWVLTDKDDPTSPQALRYDQFVGPLIKAVQQLSARVATLESA